jgi:hypothetical protein
MNQVIRLFRSRYKLGLTLDVVVPAMSLAVARKIVRFRFLKLRRRDAKCIIPALRLARMKDMTAGTGRIASATFRKDQP